MKYKSSEVKMKFPIRKAINGANNCLGDITQTVDQIEFLKMPNDSIVSDAYKEKIIKFLPFSRFLFKI